MDEKTMLLLAIEAALDAIDLLTIRVSDGTMSPQQFEQIAGLTMSARGALERIEVGDEQ